MAFALQPNWIEMTLASGSLLGSTSGTSFTVVAGQGALCEALGAGDHFYATIVNASGVREETKISARNTDTFTVSERGVDGGHLSGTTRTPGGYGSWAVGDKVYVGISRKGLADYLAAVAVLQAVSLVAVTGNVTLTADATGKLHRFTATAIATLPAAATALIGKSIRFRNTAFWSAQIARAGSDTIDGGAANVRVPALEEIELTCVSATAWEVTKAPGSEVGDIIYAAGAARRGCVLAFGQELSKTTYAGLAAVCGTTFGAETNGSGGAGTTHFRAPDLRGRVPAGKDDMGGAAANRLTSAGSGVAGATLGASGGNELMQAHSHGGVSGSAGSHTHTGVTGNDVNGHTHQANIGVQQVGLQTGPTPYFVFSGLNSTTLTADNPHTHGLAIDAASAHTHSITAEGGGASQNVQPTLVLNAFVKA
jgi:microcystin-dependent protein